MNTTEEVLDRKGRQAIMRLMALVLGVIALVTLPGRAHAQAADNLKLVLVFTGCEGDPGRVILSGALSGVGTDLRQGFQQNPDGSFAFESLFLLDDGTLRISGEGQVQSFELEPRTGVARLAFTGVFTIVEGTGALTGASGGGGFAGRAVLVPDESCPSGAQAFQVTRGGGSVTFAAGQSAA